LGKSRDDQPKRGPVHERIDKKGEALDLPSSKDGDKSVEKARDSSEERRFERRRAKFGTNDESVDKSKSGSKSPERKRSRSNSKNSDRKGSKSPSPKRTRSQSPGETPKKVNFKSPSRSRSASLTPEKADEPVKANEENNNIFNDDGGDDDGLDISENL